MTAVLHIDVDVFFCQARPSPASVWRSVVLQSCCLQVEQNLHPNLKGRAFAIQQHQDIIAVSTVVPKLVAAVLPLVARYMHSEFFLELFR